MDLSILVLVFVYLDIIFFDYIYIYMYIIKVDWYFLINFNVMSYDTDIWKKEKEDVS